MSVVRVNKSKDYTVMSNHHFRSKGMSLKAKGLLSLMLSLPDSWDYSINGLVAICKENETAIKNTLSELKSFGYLEVTKLLPSETKSGRIEYVYDVYEIPKQEGKKQEVENLGVEILSVENQTQLNTNKSNTKKLNTKHKYGEYNNVLLTDEELEKLKGEYPDYLERIERLSSYVASTGKSYKSHYATIRNWARKDEKPVIKKNGFHNFDQREYDYDNLEKQFIAQVNR